MVFALNTGGPYLFKCGDTSYLQYDDHSIKKSKEESASQFWIQGGESKGFYIAYRETKEHPYQYITHPLFKNTVRVDNYGNPSAFQLNHKTKPKDTLSITMWRNDFCLVQLKGMKLRNSYLGWKSNGVISMKGERRSEQFKLVKVPVASIFVREGQRIILRLFTIL